MRFLTLLIFAIGWAVCCRPQAGYESMMTILSFSLFFQSASTLSCVRKHLKKAACIILFIYLRAFTYILIFNGKFVAVMELLLTSFYIAANNEYLTKIQIILRHVYSAFPRLYCVKYSFKLAKTSISYDGCSRGPLFIRTQYITRIFLDLYRVGDLIKQTRLSSQTKFQSQS